MFDHTIPRVFQNRFSTQYRCFSVSMLAGPNDRSDVEKGGKSRYRLREAAAPQSGGSVWQCPRGCGRDGSCTRGNAGSALGLERGEPGGALRRKKEFIALVCN